MTELEFKKSLQTHKLASNERPELIPQEGLKISLFPDDCPCNAIWDYAISPEGRHYFSLCAELTYAGYVSLYEYIPETGEFKLCFNIEDKIITYDRNIRPSKIHTSICFMPNGKIIMTTHTTAKAPDHPHWLFMHYLNHQFEGYIGSNVLIYDPKSGKVEDLGIPVQRDTIYGACYDASHNALYFHTYLRGHTYRLDLDDRNLTDYGQTTMQGSFFLKLGRDGNIYTTTRNGCLFRINTQTQKIEDLDFQFKKSIMMPHAVDGPDGKLYMFAHSCPYLYAYDYETQKTKMICYNIPKDVNFDKMDVAQYGGGFDDYGVLWYAVSIRANDESGFAMTYLCYIDDLHGDNPTAVKVGVIGTPEHGIASCCETFVLNDTFFGVSSNHSMDPPGMFKIELEPTRKNINNPRKRLNDPCFYIRIEGGENIYDGDLFKDGERYYQSTKYFMEHNKFTYDNLQIFRTPDRDVTPVWMELGRVRSSVLDVSFDNNGNVSAVCGVPGDYTLLAIKDGDITEKTENYNYTEKNPDITANKFAHLKLPHHAGRQYKAVASAYCEIEGGKYLVGTLDGMLAIVDLEKNTVFSLGAVTTGEAIRSLASTNDGKLAYGVASDPDGFGMVFSFNIDTGITLYGYIQAGDKKGRSGHSYEPSSIAFAPDDKSIAIGAKGNMGTVYRFFLDKR